MTCPICKRRTESQWRPFCSRRCADIDLGKWFTGAYSTPLEPVDDVEEIRVEDGRERDLPH